ncbi:MAG: translation initiation factor IF-2 associated domain-containing protein, partial [Pseudomonadota bacterium]
MSDEKKTLTRKPLGLKKTVDGGQVQQQFSHGRKNTVVVERKRRFVPKKPGEAQQVKEEAAAPPPVKKEAPPAPKPRAATPKRVSEA